jgi:beta-lactamase class A
VKRALLIGAVVLAGCAPPTPRPGPLAPIAVSQPAPPPPPDHSEARFKKLAADLKRLAKRSPGGDVAFWVEDRLRGRRWAFNADRVFRSASLIKIPVAALAAETWRQNPEKRTPQIEKRVWRTIAESHNVSTDVVVDHVGGLGRVNAFCAEHGWGHTRMSHKMMAWRSKNGQNVTTARDVAAMLRSIDSGELVSPEVSDYLWGLLKDQEIVDRIPAGLPGDAGLEVGNKTGTMLSVIHDAGIVRGEDVRYLLVIMIDRPRAEPPADLYCRKVSAMVYRALATRPAERLDRSASPAPPPGRSDAPGA